MSSNSAASASVDAMAARLASSLALAEGRRVVDLRPAQGQGLRQSAAFLVGRLLTSREYKMRSFLGMFKTAWQTDGTLPVEEAEDKRVLFTLSDPNDRERIWKGGPWGFNRAPVALAFYDGVADIALVKFEKASYWITLLNIPAAFRTPRVMMMIGFTIGDFKEYDKPAKKAGKLVIRVEIPLNRPLPFKRWYTLEDGVEACCQFRYARLFGHCSNCGLVTHFGLPCVGPALNEDDPGAVRTGLGGGVVAPTVALPPPGFHAGEIVNPNPTPTFRVSDDLADLFVNPSVGVGTSAGSSARQEEPVVFKATKEAAPRTRKKTAVRQEVAENVAEVGALSGQRRAREEEMELELVSVSPKRTRLSLAVGKQHLHLSPNRLSLLHRVLEDQLSKRRGRPVGSKNKQAYGTKKKQDEERKKKRDEDRKKKKKLTRRNITLELEAQTEEGGAANSTANVIVSPDPKGKGKL